MTKDGGTPGWNPRRKALKFSLETSGGILGEFEPWTCGQGDDEAEDGHHGLVALSPRAFSVVRYLESSHLPMN